MDSIKAKRFNSSNETLDCEHSSPLLFFRNLLSAIKAPEGFKPPLLKGLYCLLVHLSSKPLKYGADSNYLETEIDNCQIRVTYKDICSLSDILFEGLVKRFEQFFSTLLDVSASRASGQASLHSDTWAAAEVLNLLLRCSMAILNLLVPEQHLLLKNGQVLLVMLRKLCSLDFNAGNEKNTVTFEKLVSSEWTFVFNDSTTSFAEDFVASLHFLQPSDPCLPFLCAMLEVFADELLVHGRLREYLNLIDSVSSSSKMLYHSSHGDIGSVMEVISAHFSLSFSDEQAFEHFLNRLFLLHGKDYRSSEISLTAAISMLLNPIMLSAPKFFQAHLISLVSEASGICMGLENMRPDLRLMDCYLSAFERSVIMYTKHMSSLQMHSHPTVAAGCFGNLSTFGENIQPSFESYIQQVTRNNVNHIITKLDNSWHSHISNMFSRTKSDLVTSSFAYMKDNQFFLDISYRDEILSILSFLILEALSGGTNDTALTTNGDTSPQDICFLASILKLMSSSLLQAIWCLRHSGGLGCLRTLKNFSSSKEYDSIVGIISCFQQFNICVPIQESLYDMMESHPIRHKESMMMLLHFLGLLSLSFGYGLDFLVKGCILALMTLMNLFIFEEGNIKTLKSLIASRSESFSIGLPTDNVPETVLDRRSSQLVASKFQKIQTLSLSAAPVAIDCTEREDGQTNTSANSSFANHMECVVGIEEETEETCNGQIFLNCILGCPKQLSDIDDIADFIECKQGKDYSGWLKDRQRYRKWKCQKMAVLRWQKKIKTWRYIKRKRT